MFCISLNFEIIQYIYLVADIGLVCDYEQRLNQSFLAHLGLDFHATVSSSVHGQYPHIR